jgi:hypothetical protein
MLLWVLCLIFFDRLTNLPFRNHAHLPNVIINGIRWARQYYDNNNSQCKPRYIGLTLRGARRISRE